jgi:hypothetical protein
VELATKLIAEGSDSGRTSRLSTYLASEAADAVDEEELEDAFAGIEAALEASRKSRLKGLGAVYGNIGQFDSMKNVAATVLAVTSISNSSVRVLNVFVWPWIGEYSFAVKIYLTYQRF